MARIDEIKEMNFIDGLKSLYHQCGLNYTEEQAIDILLEDIQNHFGCAACPAKSGCKAIDQISCSLTFRNYFIKENK